MITAIPSFLTHMRVLLRLGIVKVSPSVHVFGPGLSHWSLDNFTPSRLSYNLSGLDVLVSFLFWFVDIVLMSVALRVIDCKGVTGLTILQGVPATGLSFEAELILKNSVVMGGVVVLLQL